MTNGREIVGHFRTVFEIYLRAGQIIESFIVANKSMSETSKLKHQQELRQYMLESQRQTLH